MRIFTDQEEGTAENRKQDRDRPRGTDYVEGYLLQLFVIAVIAGGAGLALIRENPAMAIAIYVLAAVAFGYVTFNEVGRYVEARFEYERQRST